MILMTEKEDLSQGIFFSSRELADRHLDKGAGDGKRKVYHLKT